MVQDEREEQERIKRGHNRKQRACHECSLGAYVSVHGQDIDDRGTRFFYLFLAIIRLEQQRRSTFPKYDTKS